MNNLGSKLLGITILLGTFVGGWFAMDIRYFVRSPLLNNQEPLLITIAPGTGLNQLANQFERRKLTKHPRYLVWLAKWQDRADHIKAGEYEFEPGLTPAQVLDKITRGDVVQYAITLVEGWTFGQVISALQQHEKIDPTMQGRSAAEIMTMLDLPDQHPEGRFYPDTYHFPNGTPDSTILRQAYQAMEQRLEAEWQQRAEDLPYTSPYQALIMASIIEKETGVADEREQIAGVFVRRLIKGMRLQTDPTVIYGLGNDFDGNLRRRDLTSNTPYNTYMNKGLPPTPIAMPGGDSIHAALHPAEGDALYFVSRGDGTHQFSSTIEEHNKAVRKYQLRRKTR